jgi:hypothetical protein
MKWAEHAASVEEMRNAYIILVGKFDRKSPIGRPCRRWKDNSEKHLNDKGYEGVKWIHLAQDKDSDLIL